MIFLFYPLGRHIQMQLQELPAGLTIDKMLALLLIFPLLSQSRAINPEDASSHQYLLPGRIVDKVNTS